MWKIITVAALFAAPTSAQDGSTWGKVGDWTIFRADLGCSAVKTEQQGVNPSSLALFKFVDGRSALELSNDGWSIKNGQAYPLYALFDDQLFEGAGSSPSDGKIMFPLDSKMVAAFETAKFVTVFLKRDADHETPLEQFSLEQSSAALKAASQCLIKAKAEEAERSDESDRLRRRSTEVPTDPFAGTKPQSE